jgi:uroporphyrinogen decarboxylase
MEKILGVSFAQLEQGNDRDLDEFFTNYCRFWPLMTYDTVSFEVCITEILPGHGAIFGGKGPIQNRADLDRYPWDELPERFWALADRKYAALGRHLPPGMKALGGVGNGVLEISEDLVGFESLAYLLADEPETYNELYKRIGGLMLGIWKEFLRRYADIFVICRFGDDLGYRSNTLISPKLIRQHIMLQYQPVILLIKGMGKPFLWHSCGRIFQVMEDAIALGINAKHSNEDAIAPFDDWIARYSGQIGLLGGIDLDLLCQETPAEIIEDVYAKGKRFRTAAQGFALGSGNSIPDYVPVDGYMAMIEGAKRIRSEEAEHGFASSLLSSADGHIEG